MSNDCTVSSANGSPAHSDGGGNDEVNSCTKDELLLLPVTERPVARAPSPLLMQRPQSSGIDLGAFPFAKPLPSGNAFSFQSAPRPQLSGVRSNENHVRSGTRVDKESERVIHTAQSGHPKGPPAQFEISPAASDTRRLESTVTQSSERTEPKDRGAPIERRKSGGARVDKRTKERHSDVQAHEVSEVQDSRRKRKHTLGESGLMDRLGSNATTPDSAHEDPENKRPRTSRHRSENEEDSPLRGIILPNNDAAQISEDTLFQLLISRMKEREEKEAAAVDLKEQLESHISQLTEENKSLKKQIEVLAARLQKKVADSKAYRSQMEAWKARLAGFKCFLNELGSNYNTLRGEAFQLSTSKEHLDKEKAEIRVELAGIKDQIGQASGSIEEMRIGILRSQNVISSLEQDLKNGEEKMLLLRSQLSDEKIRSKSLESYIRETSRAQSKALESLRSDQANLIDKVNNSTKSTSEQLLSTHQSTRLALEDAGDALKQCLDYLVHISKEHAQDKIDLHECKAIVHESITRSEAASLDLTAEVRASSEASRQLTTEIKGQLQWIDNRLGPGSTIQHQLSSNEGKCESLQEKLMLFAPCAEKLSVNMESLRDGEQILANQIQGLQTRLSEEAVSQHNELLANNAVLLAERDKLSKEIQRLSADLTTTTETLKERDGNITALSGSLFEAQENVQKAENQAAEFQSEISRLQDKVKSVEAEVREEVSRASVIARDQHKADFEQKLHALLKEKEDAAIAIEDMDKKLLASLKELADAKILWENRQRSQDDMIAESEAKAKALNDRFKDIIAELQERDAEIKRLRDAESSSTAAKESLQSQLDAANNKISTLTQEMSVLSADAQASKDSLEQKVTLLQSSVSKKEEECTNLLVELSAAISEKSDLEATKTKAKSEIHALLRRVQDSEGWLRKIRDSLVQVGMMSTEEPLVDVLGKLESLLHSTNVNQPPTKKPADIENDAMTGLAGDACINARVPITPKNFCGAPEQEIVQTMEVIYRKQVHQSTHTSPMKGTTSEGLRLESGRFDRSLNSEPSASIVPFSNIRRCPSLAPYSSPRGDHNEFTDMLLPVSGNTEAKEDMIIPCSYQDAPPEFSESPCLGRSVRTRVHSSQVVPEERIAQNTQGDKQNNQKSEPHDKFENTPSKGKAVTFKAPSSTKRSGKRKAQESGSEADSKRLQKVTPVEQPPRSNQRTYGKVGKSASQTAKNNTIQGTCDSVQRMNSAEGPGNKDTGAKTTPHGQDQSSEPTSEYLGRKASPARLASGSSKRTPRGEYQGKDHSMASLAPRATRRRSRGDKYNARFNGRG